MRYHIRKRRFTYSCDTISESYLRCSFAQALAVCRDMRGEGGWVELLHDGVTVAEEEHGAIALTQAGEALQVYAPLTLRAIREGDIRALGEAICNREEFDDSELARAVEHGLATWQAAVDALVFTPAEPGRV